MNKIALKHSEKAANDGTTQTLTRPQNSQEHQELNQQILRKFGEFTPKRQQRYSHFWQVNALERQEIVATMEEDLLNEYQHKLFSTIHSSLETKMFCLEWFRSEKKVKPREEAIDKFEERISMEEQLGFIYERYDLNLRQKYPNFFDLRYDQKEQVLKEMLETKKELEAEEEVKEKLIQKFKALLESGKEKFLYSKIEKDDLTAEFKEAEDQNKVVIKLQLLMLETKNLWKEFNNFENTTEDEEAKFKELDAKEKKAWLKNKSQTLTNQDEKFAAEQKAEKKLAAEDSNWRKWFTQMVALENLNLAQKEIPNYRKKFPSSTWITTFENDLKTKISTKEQQQEAETYKKNILKTATNLMDNNSEFTAELKTLDNLSSLIDKASNDNEVEENPAHVITLDDDKAPRTQDQRNVFQLQTRKINASQNDIKFKYKNEDVGTTTAQKAHLNRKIKKAEISLYDRLKSRLSLNIRQALPNYHSLIEDKVEARLKDVV